MYLAVTGAILGQALLFGHLSLLLYAAIFLAGAAAFVHVYEEPTLARQFPAEYPAYHANVPGMVAAATPVGAPAVNELGTRLARPCGITGQPIRSTEHRRLLAPPNLASQVINGALSRSARATYAAS